MAVSRRLRYEVLRRDGFTCRYCWREISDRQELARRLIEDGQV